ncbi:MAG: hypothetical protein WAZ34_16960 [Rhodocyclaceae bacterium]
MTTKTTLYAHQCLAASGFAVMHSEVAWKLRPDLWGSGQECGMHFGRVDIADVQRKTATLTGIGPVLVLTRSPDMLEKRIEWVTGIKVEKIEIEQPVAPKDFSQRAKSDAQKVAIDKLARLHELAAQEPPSHDCAIRRDVLAARAELDRMAA